MGKGKGKKRQKSLMVEQVKRPMRERDPYTFDPFETWKWMKYESSHTVDPAKFVETYKNRLFFVGSDSDQKNGKCTFGSVIIAYDYDKEACCGHGAVAIRHIDKRRIIPEEALSARLTVEVQRTIEACKFVEETLLNLSDEDHDYTSNIGGVTIDVNKSDKHKSGRFRDALVGMVMAYGWEVFIKPDAWASSKVADRKVK